MKSRAPMGKIEVIERSLSCFTLGLFGLLPFIGIPMAVMAVAQSQRIVFAPGTGWNPGERYRFWGVLFAMIGIGLTAMIILFIVIAIS